ncbi:tRNA-splicing endonuclease subunit Sen54 isoform X2 [Oryzias melastigma]|uniref:TSEN54 tRNA splicing endonuclease subunit n=2 Tax=Oryzias melastigma TaxID=30732 RepID=A0A3B3DJG0_ORYME|nr:tRNA-splicing endonuclease subunit Sen54 isoform X2 [Oryzias melastigma]
MTRRRSAAAAGSNMADLNKAAREDFYNEVLSPSELFAARSRSRKIPVRGQKDFFPDDSDEQRQRLQQSLDEHWSLISEERVERLGNLVKGVWMPRRRLVELQSPAGKFWQTMGFSADGRQYLLPEEALYLMECGSVQIFHEDLPISIQDGYEMFLSADAVTLQQFQVFGHLKRLGYVVHRFDPSAEPSPYARQLNLPLSRGRAGRALKRRRSSSPTQTCSSEHAQEEDMEEEQVSSERQPAPAEENDPGTSAGEGRSWWTSEQHVDPKQTHSSAPSRWDFSGIAFPDLGSGEGLVAPPDPALLPGGLSVGVCDVASWRQKVNLRRVRESAREQRREELQSRRMQEWSREVQRCRNWVEYQELLERRGAEHQGRPAHLWSGEVTPLHDPAQPVTTAELLEKIRVIKPSHLLDGASRLSGSDPWRISFNVYQPDSAADFKKSKPGRPYARMCVCSFHGPVPDLRVIKQLASQSGDVPVVFAVVDYGDISFYTFKDFQLPQDVHP